MIGEYSGDLAGPIPAQAKADAPQPRTGDAVTTYLLPRKPLGKTSCAILVAAGSANGSRVAA